MDSNLRKNFTLDLGFYELDGEQVEADNIINLTGKNMVLLMKGKRYAYLPKLKKPDTEETEPVAVSDDNYSICEVPFVSKYPVPEEREGIIVLVDRETALALIGRKDVFIPVMTDISDLQRGWKIAKGLYRFV